jgi:hypothetical protein
MKVSEAHVARVVAEASQGASDPNHTASLVGAFMQKQPTIGHYVLSHRSEIGPEGTVLALLHASILARCVEVARGRPLRGASARELDAAAAHKATSLASDEPHLQAYLDGNITDDDPTLGGKRRPLALDLLRTITRALLDQ